MKAAVYDNPGVPAVLEYVDMPDPACGPGDVLIAVEAISIEGGDLINRRSTDRRLRRRGGDCRSRRKREAPNRRRKGGGLRHAGIACRTLARAGNAHMAGP